MLPSLLSFSMIPLISFSFYQVVLLFRVLLIVPFFISALSLPQFLPKHFLKTFYFVHVIPSVRTKFSAHVLPSAHIRPTAHVPSSAHIKPSVHFSLTLPIFYFEVLSFSVHSPLFQFYLLVWQLKYCWYSYYKLPSLFKAYCSFPVLFQIFSLNQLFLAKHFQFFFDTFPRPTYIFTARASSSEYYLSYILYTSSYPASLILNSAVTNPASSPFV